jgi:hypothetical protein
LHPLPSGLDSGEVTVDYDIFNGDADGVFALRQLRLHEPRTATLVTGVKREVALLERMAAAPGDRLTVLDVSLHENRHGLLRALAAGASCLYFDHHFSGDIPQHPALNAHIRPDPDVCTSLLVDEYLGGRYRVWAVCGAFGDNLPQAAHAAAAPLGLSSSELDALRAVGEYVNYNAYGERLEDLHFHPAELYRRLTRHADPLQFAAHDDAFERLARGYAADLQRATQATALVDAPGHLAVLLPDEAWARRISGVWANVLSTRAPARAHAVLVRTSTGMTVSVRAPHQRPHGADALARRFAGGGGRAGAAGINGLAEHELPRFLREFQQAFCDERPDGRGAPGGTE